MCDLLSWTRDWIWQVEGSPIFRISPISCSFFLLQLSHSLIWPLQLLQAYIYLFILQCCVGFCWRTMQISHSSAKSHVYHSIFYTFSLFYILMKWSPVSFFCELPSLQGHSESCLLLHLFSSPRSLPKASPLTVFFSNEACALKKRTASVIPMVTLSCLSFDSRHACRVRKPRTQGHLRIISNGIWLSDYHRVKSVVCEVPLGRNQNQNDHKRARAHLQQAFTQNSEDFCCKGREEWIT